MSTPLILVDPPREAFWPLADARPVADLLAGTRTFYGRWQARYGPVASLLCDASVTGCVFRSGSVPQLNQLPRPKVGYRVASASWIPNPDWEFDDEPAEYRCEDHSVAWCLDQDRAADLAAIPAGATDAIHQALGAMGLPVVEVTGIYCDSIWATMHANPEILSLDAADFGGGDTVSGIDPITVLGENPHVASGVSIGPFVLLDARDGPIVLDEAVTIGSHTVCRGPLYVGPHSTILGGEVGGGTSVGHQCKIRGEIEQSVFQGFANKAHDGFIGHSFLGEWVNLGADTVTSDLKNTYGQVRVTGPTGRVETGLQKVGAFLGDHVKTGIGSLLTTGTRFGLGTHFFGGRSVSPDYLPDFSWHDGIAGDPVRLEPFLETTATVMSRRDQTLTDPEREMLRALHAGGG